MTTFWRLAGQAIVYAGFAAMIGYFAASPSYSYRPEDQAEIKLSFSHGGQRRDCRQLSSGEIAKLPPNMRVTRECSRERRPVLVEVEVDDVAAYRALLRPSGLSCDGPSRVYRRFVITQGQHRLVLRLRDGDRSDGFDYERVFDIDLRARQNLVIDFRAESGGFILR